MRTIVVWNQGENNAAEDAAIAAGYQKTMSSVIGDIQFKILLYKRPWIRTGLRAFWAWVVG